MICDWDDWGCNRIISDTCQSHDCRDQLDRLHNLNPAFKCTLFAIPGEMTPELEIWCNKNSEWIRLGWHGFYHSSNYECEKMTYEEFDANIFEFKDTIAVYDNIFRAPGWKISDGIYRWLQEHDWVVCDQGYNDERRPSYMNAYVNYDGQFKILPKVGSPTDVEAYHGHVWDVGWNGIEEDWEKVSALVKNADSFQFISELFV